MQLFHATNLTDTNAPLLPVALGDLVTRMRTDEHLRDELVRLRRVKSMDADAFKRLKTRLPIFCCGSFRDGLRRTANFESIGAFVLDIDHFSGDREALSALRTRLVAADDRIAMAFVSPGGDGLKLLFGLDRPCTDTKQFSDFYKAFAYAFGEKHGLTAFLDFRTSDATRVCFLSFDVEAYFDPLAVPVQWGAYLPEAVQPLLAQVAVAGTAGAGARMVASGAKGEGAPRPVAASGGAERGADARTLAADTLTEHPNRSHQIRPDVYKEILAKLETKARPNPLQREVYTPAVLEEIVGPITEGLAMEGIKVASVRNISFAKQFELQCGVDQAGLNVFYGKRGFSVVVVPRQNTSLSLGDLCRFLAEQVIYSRHEWQHGSANAADVDQNPYAGV